MKTLRQLQEEREQKTTELLATTRTFFAFSTQQFEENKTEKEEQEKYVSTGYGAYMPKSQADNYMQGLERIAREFDQDIQANDLRAKYILYELNNHECFYTGDIEDAHASLVGTYTREEVAQVYKDYRAKKYATPTTCDHY
jgi:hypothetical protein